ncbi:MAG: hypothetical protein V1835_02965 [Candidatus Micrarchaeota archaeon]
MATSRAVAAKLLLMALFISGAAVLVFSRPAAAGQSDPYAPLVYPWFDWYLPDNAVVTATPYQRLDPNADNAPIDIYCYIAAGGNLGGQQVCCADTDGKSFIHSGHIYLGIGYNPPLSIRKDSCVHYRPPDVLLSFLPGTNFSVGGNIAVDWACPDGYPPYPTPSPSPSPSASPNPESGSRIYDVTYSDLFGTYGCEGGCEYGTCVVAPGVEQDSYLSMWALDNSVVVDCTASSGWDYGISGLTALVTAKDINENVVFTETLSANHLNDPWSENSDCFLRTDDDYQILSGNTGCKIHKYYPFTEYPDAFPGEWTVTCTAENYAYDHSQLPGKTETKVLGSICKPPCYDTTGPIISSTTGFSSIDASLVWFEAGAVDSESGTSYMVVNVMVGTDPVVDNEVVNCRPEGCNLHRLFLGKGSWSASIRAYDINGNKGEKTNIAFTN